MHTTLRLRSSASRKLLCFATTFVFLFVTALAHAKDYTRIVVFGDSLSDTGNVTHLFQQDFGYRIPGTMFDYTDGRFTDGFDTIPAAQKYFGVWIEQFAAAMPSRPAVKNSLDGGTNYAYGFATTGDGTGSFAPGSDPTFAVEVDNIGTQITTYLATHPKINNSTLFVIWGGANDLIHATSPDAIGIAAIQETLDIQRLINAGATQFLVLNLPPLGLTPRLNGSADSAAAGSMAAAGFNSWLATGLATLQDMYPDQHIAFFQLDVYALFNRIAASPADFSLTNITAPSQGNYTVDPDNYLFWDDIHPTTRGHSILAEAAIKLVASPQCDSWGAPSCAATVH
jgi:phospholipase/lecithinase/hemolysin